MAVEVRLGWRTLSCLLCYYADVFMFMFDVFLFLFIFAKSRK